MTAELSLIFSSSWLDANPCIVFGDGRIHAVQGRQGGPNLVHPTLRHLATSGCHRLPFHNQSRHSRSQQDAPSTGGHYPSAMHLVFYPVYCPTGRRPSHKPAGSRNPCASRNEWSVHSILVAQTPGRPIPNPNRYTI